MSQDVKRKRKTVKLQPKKKQKNGLTLEKASQRAPAVRSDALKWKAVTLPDRLEDSEGFFGLEEIEDVEVVRSENGGVFFQAPSAQIEDSATSTHDEDEWAGFDETEENSLLDENPVRSSRETEIDGDHEIAAFRVKDDGKPRRSRIADAQILNDKLDFTLLSDNQERIETDVAAWTNLKLSGSILSALSSLGYSQPTPIQQASIPPILAGNDVIGKAVTGSGKTLAFGIPVVEKWLKSQPLESIQSQNNPTALILAPTRELAHQLAKHLRALCEALEKSPKIVPVTGGLSILKQQRQLETADIIIATPGRLWEVINTSTGIIQRLKQINFLVLDEADRLLSEGHFKEVEEILDVLEKETTTEEDEDIGSPGPSSNKNRQTLVFSATFHKGLQQKLTSKQKFSVAKSGDLQENKLSMEYLLHKLPFQSDLKPTFIDANPDSQMAANLSETILECGGQQKDLFLYAYLLQEHHLQYSSVAATERLPRILVFTNSISTVRRLVPLLQSLNLPSTTILPLHSNMAQKARLRSLERFSDSKSAQNGAPNHTYVLIATDVAARGLDIKGISTIIHYHVPRAADTYVHRSGRTARIQNAGKSILLCSPDETAGVTRLIARVHAESNREVKDIGKLIDRMYLSPELIREVERRVSLAQQIIDSTQSTEKVKSEENWLQKAAEDLGVDYDSEEFEEAVRRGRRGRGGGRERKQKKVAADEDRAEKLAKWRAQLREELNKRISFGNGASRNAKYLAGGGFDVERLLADRGQL